MALQLEGTKDFAYRNAGPVTDKQRFIIELIHLAFKDYSSIRFYGGDSKDAYKFIGKYYKRVYFNRYTNMVYLKDRYGNLEYKGTI